MPLNPNDELNILTRRSIPFKEFFGKMGISREQKKRRIRLAEIIAGIYYVAFSLIETQNDFNLLNFAAVAIYIRNELIKAYEAETGRISDAYLAEHALQQASEIVSVTKRRIDEPYFTSDDRADLIAENDANSIIGYDELQDAIDAGYTLKTWHGMLDKRERDTHIAMEGTTVPIEQPFDVGGSFLMMPGDWSLDPDPAEVVNCRCWLTFS